MSGRISRIFAAVRVPSVFVLAGLGIVGLVVSSVQAAPERDTESPLLTWLEEQAAYYAAHPELTTQRGSGWKPYNRIKWFTEERLVNGEEPPVGARWRAWEAKGEFERLRAAQPRASWFSLGPANLAGRMLDLEFDPSNPNILYGAAASGGLWKSFDGGHTWTPLTDDLPTLGVGAVAVLPSNPNVVLMGTGEGTYNYGRVSGVGVLKSTDGGITWSTTSLNYDVAQGHGFHVMEVNPLTGTILAGATDGLWRSTDAGETWTAVKAGGNYFDVKWKPGDANRVYCVKGSDSVGNSVKVSTDDGLTWTKAGTGQPAYNLIGKSKLSVTPADPSLVYVIYVNRSTSAMLGVYRSTDDGETWTLQADEPNMTGGQGWYDLTLHADPNDAAKVIAGGVSLYRSLDCGVTWSTIGGGIVHVDHHGIAYRPGDDDNVFVACDGGVWESTNDGSTWGARNDGLVTYQFYDICVNNHSADPDFIMGGTQDQGTDAWTGTTTWSEGLGADGMVCNVNPLNGNVVYAEIQFGAHYKNYSRGSGQWWDINYGITGDGAWVTPVDQDQNQGNHLYTSTGAGIFRTTTGGSEWEQVATHQARWISISRLDGNVVWTVASTGVKVTTDDGASWSGASSYGFSTGTATKILADPADVNAAFVTFSGYEAGLAHVARTTDFGATWQDLTGDFPDQPVNAIAIDPLAPTYWYIGTDVGVWASTNGGANWIPYEVGLPNTVVVDLEIQHTTRKLFAGTHGRGAWEVNILPPLSTSAEIAATPPPVNLMLEPAYPNPVRGEAVLRFAARHAGEISLRIYDVRGRLVNDVAALPVGDGIIRRAVWLTDDVPNGVYFAVLSAGEERVSRKVIVAK
jgi:hypothetical protein